MKDLDWVQKTMMIPNQGASLDDGEFEKFHKSNYKFTDTSLGGNFAANPPPQFTPTADLRATGSINAGLFVGMGRKYSAMIDDNSQIIHLRMGIPQFNSLTTFFTGFYDRNAANLARTGRGEMGWFESAGYLIGSVLTAPLIPIIFVGNLFKRIMRMPPHKFYYSKPSMPVYWQAVNTIANMLAVNTGIGAIDVFKIINRAQKKANELRIGATHMRRDTGASLSEFKRFGSVENDDMPEGTSLEEHLANWLEESAGGLNTNGDKEGAAESAEDNVGFLSDFMNFGKSELHGGGAFASFRVNHTGEVSDSFSNQTAEPDVKSKFNSTSASAASKRFDFADGNIGGPIGGVVNAIADVTSGLLTGVGLSGLVAMAGSAYVDIPDTWKDSSASLSSMSYTMELKSPYGNPMSRLTNIYIPLAMIMAAALPKAAGKAAYTWPFLVELYDKGRIQTRMGMIDSLSISRGTGSVGWSQDNEALGITVSFTVKDLSSIVAMPIGLKFFDESTMFSDYIAAISSLDVNDQAYPIEEMKLNFQRKAADMKKLTSGAYWAQKAAGTLPGRGISALMRFGAI